ncbi:uncharacterized protein G2W53_004912 [Senna tora]|uniref:Uncharacterized protein n=1 Tax=Senna tora TaxID=362788 RepID=A0A834XDY6_9FABA|nr:uncharacterized protein G2W53_004912 [Senna tora]
MSLLFEASDLGAACSSFDLFFLGLNFHKPHHYHFHSDPFCQKEGNRTGHFKSGSSNSNK